MSFSLVWPIILIVLSNVAYQICAKSIPADVNPLASVTVTYLVGAAVSAVLYFLIGPERDLIREYSRLNWAPFVLGVVIVGLEAGMTYAYKAGWQVNTLYITQSAFIAVALLAVGRLLFREQLSWTKLLGTVIVLIGLAFINRG